jgi:mannan endo-1,4-beta-mannosidase
MFVARSAPTYTALTLALDYAGTNSYWIPFLTNDNDVDTIMSHLQSSGQKILRIWGFNDVKTVPGSGTVYFQSFSGSTATINTGANGLQRLDAVVKAAEKYGIKLIINFVNNWTGEAVVV